MRSQNTEEAITPKRYLKAFLFGTVVGVVLLTVIGLIFALAYTMVDLPDGVLIGMMLVASAGSGMGSGYVAARLIGRKGLIIGGMNGILLSLTFFLLGIAFFGIELTLIQGIKTVLIIFFSVCGGIFGVNNKKVRI